MKESVLVAGKGGQGIVLAGSILSYAADHDKLFTTAMATYGVEMRGGTTTCSVIISDNEVSSPVITEADTAILMSPAAFDKHESSVKDDGTIFLNCSDCKAVPSRKSIKIIEVEATKIAEELGDIRAANMVMLGAYLKHKKILKLDTAINAIEMALPNKKNEINIKAMKKGAE